MRTFQVEQTDISDLVLIHPFFAEDKRGTFLKNYEREIFRSAGISLDPFESFYTRSSKGVLRGLHFQREHSQDKLVQVLCGVVYDVAVDLRKGSPTFGQWEGFTLTAENREMLYIPRGFAHGLLALEEGTLFSYLCGDRYDPASDGGVRWDDPQIGVRWPLDQVEHITLSDKDAALPTLAEFTARYGALTP